MQPMPLTIDQFREALPDKMKKSVHQDLIDQVNKVLAEPEMFETYRDNLLSYTKVMQDGKYKIEQYLAAVKYVSHKLMGCTNIDAYSRTFPDRIARFAQNKTSDKDVSAYVSAYNKSKLVNAILEQTLIPMWVLNQDIYQKAISVQAELMVSANSEKVRTDAANSLLTHLKPPETKKIELDVGVKQDISMIDMLRQATMDLAEQQSRAIQMGVQTALGAAHSKVVINQDMKEVNE